MKLAVFDFDSTLMEGETLEFLAKEVGIEQEVKRITDLAMKGELDFFESLQKRVMLLKGISAKRVDEICHNLPLTKGAKETVAELKNKGYKIVCFSGGFKNATEHFANILGLDAQFSNILHSKNGFLTGFVGGEMMFGTSKGEMLKQLQNLLGIDYHDTIVVGDGANDISMFQHAGTRIAFCAKPILKEHANIIIEEKNLENILIKLS